MIQKNTSKTNKTIDKKKLSPNVSIKFNYQSFSLKYSDKKTIPDTDDLEATFRKLYINDTV